jgi:cell division protein FtsL
MAENDVALRKRAQIAKANRVMLIWVMIVSVVIGFSAVASVFLVNKLVYNQKVINEKNKTVSTLDKNLKSIDGLKDQIRALNSNAALQSVKAGQDDDAVQVVLDALPSSPNSLALGASLQNRILSGINGLTIEQLQVDTVNADGSSSSSSASGSTQQNSIPFRMTVVGDVTALDEVLTRLERSIRTIDVTGLTIESRGNNQALIITAQAFYQPETTIQLKDKEVPR